MNLSLCKYRRTPHAKSFSLASCPGRVKTITETCQIQRTGPGVDQPGWLTDYADR